MNLQIKLTSKPQTPTAKRKVYKVRPENSTFIEHPDFAFRWHNLTGRVQYVSISSHDVNRNQQTL